MRLAVIVIAAALSLFVMTASARDYPFCALGSKSSEGMQCDYSTLSQCQAATAGGGGSCIANPRAGASRPPVASPTTTR